MPKTFRHIVTLDPRRNVESRAWQESGSLHKETKVRGRQSLL